MTIEAGPPDRIATTLAILRVNHEREVSYLDSYLPFAYHCLQLLSNTEDPIGARPVQRLLRSEFGLALPLGVVRSLLRRAAEEGKLRDENRLLFLIDDQLADCSLNRERAEFGRRFSHLAASLAQYAYSEHDLGWGASRAKSQLLTYVDHFSSDILAAALDGKPIPKGAPHDMGPDLFVAHQFASHISECEPDEFDFLVGLVKARMLSDSLHLDIEQGQEKDLRGVRIYFDGPVLLFALGYAGDEIQAPYIELIDMLAEQGAQLFTFHHSLVEAQQILDVAANRKSAAINGEQYYGDVVGFLVRSDRSRTDIEIAAQRLEENLNALGIERVDTPDHIQALQPDETAMENLIQEYIPTIRRPALLKDVDSLTAIHTLRRGRTPRTLSSSVAVLVTHNYALFKASARFFRQRRTGRSVPHCVYDASFTTVVWLQQPKRFPNLPRELILADAAAAMHPTERLWREYNTTAQKLFDRGAIDQDDLRFLRYSEDAKVLLMDMTRGNPGAFTDATLPELLELHRKRSVREVEARALERQSELEDALADERQTRVVFEEQAQAESDRGIATILRVSELSRSAATVFANSVALLTLALAVLGVVASPIGPVSLGIPGFVLQVSAAVALTFTIWGLVVSGSVKDFRDISRDWAAARIETLLLRLLRLR
jgi:hypothetical protein